MAKTAARARGQHDSVDGVDTHCSDTLTWQHARNALNEPQIPLFFGSAVISGVIGAMGKFYEILDSLSNACCPVGGRAFRRPGRVSPGAIAFAQP